LTGRYGADGTDDFPNDPYALSRIYTTPYLLLEPSLSLVLVDGEDSDAVVGYCLAALDTTSFFAAAAEVARYQRSTSQTVLDLLYCTSTCSM
jgi:hypothetical protein